MAHEHPPGFLKGQRVFAFCGIAGPQRFLSTLQELGAEVVGSLAFPDHYEYPADSLKRIKRAFGDSSARYLVTTEKDMVKLEPSGAIGKEIATRGFLGTGLEGMPVLFLRIGLDIEHGFSKRFEAALRGRAPQSPEAPHEDLDRIRRVQGLHVLLRPPPPFPMPEVRPGARNAGLPPQPASPEHRPGQPPAGLRRGKGPDRAPDHRPRFVPPIRRDRGRHLQALSLGARRTSRSSSTSKAERT